MEVALSISYLQSAGGNFEIRITGELRMVQDLCLTAVSVVIGGIYAGYRYFRPLVVEAIHAGFGGERNDQEIRHMEPGSQVVFLHCSTDERFLEVLEDYKRGLLKTRLLKEFFKISYEVKEMDVEIVNLEEVSKKAEEIIRKRQQRPGGVLEPGESKPKRIKITPRIIVQSDAYYLVVRRQGAKEKRLMHGVAYAAKQGYEILNGGGTAVDAVEKAVSFLEDKEYFNAGRGSLLNINNEVECDAMIMDGEKLDSGAVLGARHFFNPVKIARKIMEDSNHCALTGDGALEFDKKNGYNLHCDPQELTGWTKPPTDSKLEEFKQYTEHSVEFENVDEKSASADTVSAVAVDSNGHFACATSTGGIPGKLKGRVGDAPLVGCGGYASKFGATTVSGHGESLIKMTLARNIIYKMEKEGQDAQKATENALKEMKDTLKTYGCAIAIDKNGNIGRATTSSAMLWASVVDNEFNFGLERNWIPKKQQK